MFFSRVPTISPKKLESKLNEKPLIIDVRSAEEFRSGHIPGSRNVPLHKIERFVPKKECIVVCASGARSRQAAKQLQAKGFDVVNLRGGLNAWRGKLRGGKF